MMIRMPVFRDGGGFVDTSNDGARRLLDDSPPVTRTSFLPQLPTTAPPPPADIAFLPNPTRPVLNAAEPSTTGPAVESSSASIDSPAPAAGDGKAQELPTVTVEGKPAGKTSIPWVSILIVLGVTIAIIVAVKVFAKRV